MSSGAARLAQELTADAATVSCRLEQAVVATVTAAAAADGNALVEVTWRGGTHAAAYLASYTPTVGHTVTVAVQPPAGLLILGRPIGTPPAV
jgi:hypothetical protein